MYKLKIKYLEIEANKKGGTINILIINAYRLQLHRKPDVKPKNSATPFISAPRQFAKIPLIYQFVGHTYPLILRRRKTSKCPLPVLFLRNGNLKNIIVSIQFKML